MNFDREQMKNTIERNVLDFVGTRSDTNSLEKNVEGFFQKWFQRVPYFQKNKEYCGHFPIPDDYLDRTVSWCLLKGNGDDTIVFIHHHDIVETKDYLTLESLSLKPYELMEAFKNGKMEMPEDAKKDLDSGDWLFGRGASDMKGGGSIQLSLLESYSELDSFNGNIVLISVPDEENLSAGMRGAAFLLKELTDQYGLKYVLMLNSEPHERSADLRPTFYDGSVGKIMPVVYVRGKLAHVGQVFQGLNPINLLSEIVRRTELNQEFMDKGGNTVSPPPTWLYAKDRKTVYDVSLPIATCGYMSILPLVQSPKQIMDKIKTICTEAFEQVIKDMNDNYKGYLRANELPEQPLPWKTNVKLYSELFAEAKRDSGEAFEKAYKETMESIKTKFQNNQISTIDAANVLIEKTLEFVTDLSPVVVIALAPPYYPNTNNAMLGAEADKANKTLEELLAYAKDEFNESYTVQNYFTGISDLSYAMFVSDAENIRYIENNMMMWKDVYYIPLEIIKEISMPVLNVGPWGKDLHKYTERVYTPDLFYKTPKLIDFVVGKMLNNK